MLKTPIFSARLASLLAALVAMCGTASAGSLTVEWDANPEPDLAGYVLHVGSEPGLYTERIDVGVSTSHVLTTVAGRRYCFAVSAYFAAPRLEGGKSPEVCTAGDLPPTLTNPGALSHPLGGAVSVALSAVDPEGGRLTFSAVGLPAGLGIAAATGVISGSPTTAGSYAVTVKVSDGSLAVSQSFTWTIGASVPAAPTLLRPSGASSASPTFEWTAVASATSYRIWVDDAGPINPRVQVDLTPAALGCAAAGSVCRTTPAVVFAGGAASWSVRASNATGDGPWSGAMDFTVADTRSPSISIVSPTTGSTLSTGKTDLALAGTAADDASVTQVSWSTDRGAAGIATGTTNWSVSGLRLPVGLTTITVTARDAAGNTARDTLSVTVADLDRPVLSIVSPTTTGVYATGLATVTVAGTASDDFGVASVSWTSSRGGSGTATGTKTWTIPSVELKVGLNQITVTATDTAGKSSSQRLSITARDGQVPSLAITSPAAKRRFLTRTPSVVLAGTAGDDFGVLRVRWLTERGRGGEAVGTTQWSTGPIDLHAGINVITVTVTDVGGNRTSDDLRVVVDDEAPVLSLRRPSAAGAVAVSTATLDIAGTARDTEGVTKVTWSNSRGGGGDTDGTRTWSAVVTALQPGPNVITVAARDEAGNEGTLQLTVIRDDVAPTIAIDGPALLSTGQSLVRVRGVADDNVGVTGVSWSSDRGAGGTAAGATTWSALVPVVAGRNVFTVTSRDAAGHSSSATLTIVRQ